MLRTEPASQAMFARAVRAPAPPPPPERAIEAELAEQELARLDADIAALAAERKRSAGQDGSSVSVVSHCSGDCNAVLPFHPYS